MSEHQDPALSAIIVEPEEWLESNERFSGEWQGADSGSAISIIANHIETVGGGAESHQHPYKEVFLVRRGRVIFEVGDEVIEAHEGQIVVAPANVPHAFHNPGPGTLEMIDIHESSRFDTRWV